MRKVSSKLRFIYILFVDLHILNNNNKVSLKCVYDKILLGTPHSICLQYVQHAQQLRLWQRFGSTKALLTVDAHC